MVLSSRPGPPGTPRSRSAAAKETALGRARETMIRLLAGCPPHHGVTHHLLVERHVGYLCLLLGLDDYLPRLVALIHDLHYSEEEERKARGLSLDKERRSGSQPALILEALFQSGYLTAREKSEVERQLARVALLPTRRDRNLGLAVVRDADRLSRLGREGLLSILEANRDYGVPFYLEGDPVDWSPDVSLLPNRKIRSCISDVVACLSWRQIIETPPARVLFDYLAGFNLRFLAEFREGRNPDYEYWINWIGRQGKTGGGAERRA